MDCDRYRRLTDADTHDETIPTTLAHPWLTADHGWTLAGTLQVGEPVREADGTTAIVEALRVVPGAASMWDNVHVSPQHPAHAQRKSRGETSKHQSDGL